MHALAPDAGPSRREVRRMARQERRQHLREMREAARREAAPPVSRLLPTRPVPADEARGTIEDPATTASLPPREAAALACPAVPEPAFSGIPWTQSGPYSLNPLPRYAARADLDWRR